MNRPHRIYGTADFSQPYAPLTHAEELQLNDELRARHARHYVKLARQDRGIDLSFIDVTVMLLVTAAIGFLLAAGGW